MFSKLILFLPQMSANVDQTNLLKCFRPQNVTIGGTNQKTFLLAPLAALFFLTYPTLKTVASRVIATVS